MSEICFENVSKSYDGKSNVLNNLSFSIEKGEFVTLVGPSGCGKTTLLKLVNRLINADKGQISVHDKDINRWDPIDLRRKTGYVIQQSGLFPHMTILENITYVQSLIGEDKEVKTKTAEKMIELVGLDDSFLSKYPGELSGGQKQRIGFARALAADPGIILMDEPFGAVDEISRVSLQNEITAIHKKVKKTILFVTHDIEEALKLGTKIILLNKGNIEQEGTRNDMIFKPKSEFVKKFFGLKNFISFLSSEPVSSFIKKTNVKTLDKAPSVEDSTPILEVIRLLFDQELEKAEVVDNRGELKGVFSIDDILRFKKMKT